MEAPVARFLYPVAVAGFTAAAVLNAITWLPIDVSGLTGLWVLLFIGIFPVWFPVVLILAREQKTLRTAAGRTRWYGFGPSLSWRAMFVGVPRWVLVLGVVLVAYVGVNFFASLSLLPGQPEASGGAYYFNNHGSHIPTDIHGYLDGLRYQMRIFTGHPMIFYGVAALTMYGRRSPRKASP